MTRGERLFNAVLMLLIAGLMAIGAQMLDSIAISRDVMLSVSTLQGAVAVAQTAQARNTANLKSYIEGVHKEATTQRTEFGVVLSKGFRDLVDSKTAKRYTTDDADKDWAAHVKVTPNLPVTRPSSCSSPTTNP